MRPLYTAQYLFDERYERRGWSPLIGSVFQATKKAPKEILRVGLNPRTVKHGYRHERSNVSLERGGSLNPLGTGRPSNLPSLMGLVVVEGVESPLDLPSDTLIFMPRVGNSVGNCKFGQQKRGYDFHRNPLISFMAGVTRLELATSGVTGRRSNQTELHPRNFLAGGRNRA